MLLHPFGRGFITRVATSDSLGTTAIAFVEGDILFGFAGARHTYGGIAAGTKVFGNINGGLSCAAGAPIGDPRILILALGTSHCCGGWGGRNGLALLELRANFGRSSNAVVIIGFVLSRRRADESEQGDARQYRNQGLIRGFHDIQFLVLLRYSFGATIARHPYYARGWRIPLDISCQKLTIFCRKR